MQYDTALMILQALADGIDPDTGEILPSDHLLLRPEVIRALYTACAALSQPVFDERVKSPRVRTSPTNAGVAWTREEDDRLLAAFDGGATVGQLAKAHERSRRAIEIRLARHQRIVPVTYGDEEPGEPESGSEL